MNNQEEIHSLIWELVDLAGHLRQERLFTSSEQSSLQELNKKVVTVSCDLFRLAWITSQQRISVNKLMVSRSDSSPSSCCRSVNLLDSANFVEAYKIIGYEENLHCVRLLEFIKHRPQLLAKYLAIGDRIQSDQVKFIIDSVIAGLYGSCFLSDDKILVLKLLLYLTRLQIVNSDDPRRLMRHKSCAFAHLYSLFHEGLYSATLFLTAALYTPVMALLMEDERFLDIDPDKADVRFTTAEKLRMFGTEGSPEYVSRLQKYREWTINKLVSVTNKFIDSIKENIHCFPSSICWLVRHIYKLLMMAGKLQQKEVFAICVDLVFTSFICPAIVNPEQYGILDASVSYVARFNLIQVAKILQMLVMRKYESIDPKVEDLYARFDENCLSSIMSMLLEDAMEKSDEEPIIADNNSQLKGLCRSPPIFFTPQQFRAFVNYLQLVAASSQLDDPEKGRLVELLSPVSSSAYFTGSSQNDSSSDTGTRDGPITEQGSSPTNTPKKSANILTKVSKNKITSAIASTVSNIADEYRKGDGSETGSSEQGLGLKIGETVLIFELVSKVDTNIGLLTEQQVLENSLTEDIQYEDGVSNATGSEQALPPTSGFSLSTSQDGEGVSEAASNHSEDSSMEMEAEYQNDNLSDMISANVSGRGTPNISGRDTPSSQIAENENDPETPEPPPQPAPVTKQTRFDLDDKFGKFEIKNMLHPRGGDETVSLVSDTWSTDVLSSDTEMVEQAQNQMQGLMPGSCAELSTLSSTFNNPLPDISETTSEAWSTDVVASDSDRVTEIDTDDTASVARSDVTTGTRSEVESRGDPDGNEDISSHSCVTSNVSTYSMEESSTVVSITDGSFDMKQTNFASSSRCAAAANTSATFTSYVSRIKTATSTSSADVTQLQDGGGSSIGSSSTGTYSPHQMSVDVEDGNVNDVDMEENQDTATKNATPKHTNSSNGNAVLIPDGTSSPISATRPPVIKSISFDKTAEKGDKDMLDERSKRSSFFKNFKLAFKNRRGKPFRMDQWAEASSRSATNTVVAATASVMYNVSEDETAAVRFSSSDFPKRKQPTLQIYPAVDTSEDILAKYRSKSAVSEEKTSSKTTKSSSEDADSVVEDSVMNGSLDDVEIMFDSAKKKLRLVLSTAEIQQIPCTSSNNLLSVKETWCLHQNVLVAFLQLQLAEAINLKDRTLIAHLHETVRCVRAFDNKRCRKLLESLKEDYKSRAPYLSYLMRCRQTLLSAVANIDRLIERIKCEQNICKQLLTLLCVRLFLKKWDNQVSQFSAEFQKLKLADEKNDLLHNFLKFLYAQMKEDPTWQGVSEKQMELAKTSVERDVISKVYFYAMFPNGDGDISRDQVLHEHMKKLSKVITPYHKDLRIPKKYHNECPWPSAQQELIAISAYKTPQEKLKCILRCTQTILNLLSLASRTAPSADHIVPVLIYVLIKSNPSSLLSTIQYVNSFYGLRIRGEEHYWWVQFCSAVEFIKTMDYGN